MSSLAQQPTLDAFSEEPAPPTALVYTDGGCDPNPGPGGWAALLQIAVPGEGPAEIVLTGCHPDTTNNRMELEAALAALAYLHGRYGACRVELRTDSRYLRSGIRTWIARWVDNGWQTIDQQAVKNRDLWQPLYVLAAAPQAPLSVEWRWVKGHAGDPRNERVDRLATEARARLSEGDLLLPSIVSRCAPTPQTEADAGPMPLVIQEGDTIRLSVAVSCRGARGPGGWAAVLSKGAQKRVMRGHEPEATNASLALQAVLSALRALEAPVHLTVQTTEDYLVKGASEWAHTWRQRGWLTADNKPVRHRELWQALLAAAEPHHVTWQFVPKRALTADLAEARQAAARATRAPA